MEQKIFVGNIPFESTQEEFDSFFTGLNIIGLMRSDLILKSDKNETRGFGFLTFNNILNSKKFINTYSNLEFKGRILRLTEYVKQQKNNNINNIICQKNLIIIKNFPNNFTREDLYETMLSVCSPEMIGRYYIASNTLTGRSKNYGVVEILDNLTYDHVSSNKYISINGLILEINKYNLFNKNKIFV